MLGAVLVLAAILDAGQAIFCYVCNSNQDARCSDPFISTKPKGFNDTSSTSSLGLRPIHCGDNVGDTQTIANFIAKLDQVPVTSDESYRAAACQKIQIKVLGQTVTGRGCSGAVMERIHPCDAFKLLATSDLVLEFCGVCESDVCNDGSSFGGVASFMALALVLCVL